MPDLKLSWSDATVKDARLTVALTGEVPKGWKQSFERTVKLLGDGDWGAVELKKGNVQVAEVTPGTEEKLRHHLEAVVAQANAALERAEDESRDEDRDEPESEPDGADADMTARFRSFGDDEDA
jgi:hypothetical protein